MFRILIGGLALAASSAVSAYSVDVIGEQNEHQRGYISAWESSWDSEHDSKARWQFDENSFTDALAEIAERKENWFSRQEARGPGDIDWQDRKEQWFERLAERLEHNKYDWLHGLPSERREALKEMWRKKYRDHDGGMSNIPLPASVWLLLSGFGALLGWKKRQAMKATA